MPRLLMLLSGLLVLPAWAAPGSLIKDEDLKATPAASADTLARLTRGSAVEVLARKGGWTQVKGGGKTGWVRILSVRSQAVASAGADLAALVERRDGSRVVAVAGLRGLGEEALKAARLDANELIALDRYLVDRAGAEQFARAAALARREVAHLPAPRPEARPGDNPWGEAQP